MFCVVTMTGAESLKEKFSKFIGKKDKDEMEMKKKKSQVWRTVYRTVTKSYKC